MSRQPALTPARQHLARQQERVRLIEAELARLAEAREKIGRPQVDAVDEAETALAKARAREPTRLVDEALGRAGDEQVSVTEAEAELARIKVEMERRRTAQLLLDGEEQRLHASLRFALTDRREAIAAILHAECLASLFVAFDAALDRVGDLRSLLLSLPGLSQRDLDRASVVGHPGSGRGVAQFRAALAAMETDPAAPLPDDLFGDESVATAKAA
jgi:hypothetical protein